MSPTSKSGDAEGFAPSTVRQFMNTPTPTREAVVSLARQMQAGADSEKRRAEQSALKVLLNIDAENSRWLTAEAYGMHRAYQHCAKELDQMRVAIERGDILSNGALSNGGRE